MFAGRTLLATKKIYDNYDVSSIGFTLPRSVPVDRRLRDYELFDWRSYQIQVVPTPGHTKGSISFLVEVDGQRVGFCGDLIAEPGKLHTIHDLQWQYGMPDAVGAALHSVTMLAGKGLQQLMPSHGQPMSDAPAALASGNSLRRLYDLQASCANPGLPWPPRRPAENAGAATSLGQYPSGQRSRCGRDGEGCCARVFRAGPTWRRPGSRALT